VKTDDGPDYEMMAQRADEVIRQAIAAALRHNDDGTQTWLWQSFLFDPWGESCDVDEEERRPVKHLPIYRVMGLLAQRGDWQLVTLVLDAAAADNRRVRAGALLATANAVLHANNWNLSDSQCVDLLHKVNNICADADADELVAFCANRHSSTIRRLLGCPGSASRHKAKGMLARALRT
jgi:hypothetical protein